MSVGVFTEDKANLWGKTYSPRGLVTACLSILKYEEECHLSEIRLLSLKQMILDCDHCLLHPAFSLQSLLGICLFHIEVWNPCRAMRPLENQTCSSEFTPAPNSCALSEMREKSGRECWCGKSTLLHS